MINKEKFSLLKEELEKIKHLPLGWGGRKQNNSDDDRINLFSINELSTLAEKIKHFDESTKQYYIRRWMIIKISDCDEYLFNQFDETEHNPDKYSKEYDFIIKSFKFDLKGTRVPMKFKDSIKEVILNPQRIIDFYYEQQSRGRRLGMQNRLFVVTIDENNYSDELKLRLDFEVKKEAFEKYINNFDKNMNLFEFNYEDKILYADIIFIIKNNEKISIKIASDLLN